MLNANIKQQINTARDILVGKIPDPKGQIDQITNALIYKFMDDQDRLALTLPGGKANFFVNELKPYAWHKLFDGKLSNQDKSNLYVEGIAKLSISKHLPDLFRDIFKDAFLPFRAPDTIAMFLGEINKFDYHHSEDLGNAFEYLLSIMGSQGDAGQFRTPRNIIEFIVDAVDPSKDDHILDPACGTAGFLVDAYKHITKDKKLTPNEIQELAQHIHGVDIDPGMAKIARVNLYLHGFKTPLITEDDTLSNERLWGKKYDVILANPPFMTPKGGIVPHDKFSVKSNRAEVLFTDYIAEHLKLAGRAGVVVPEGIIFQSGAAYKKLRKMLVDDNYLWAVISLPSGVFSPYSGVKTSVLILDRERASKNEEVLFIKIEDTGFDLGATKREIKKNDIPNALEVIRGWKNKEKIEFKKSWLVNKEEIRKTEDYNLSGDRYRVSTEIQSKFDLVELGELIEEKAYRIKEQKEIEVWSVSNKDGFVLSSEYFDKQVASANISNYKIIKPGYFAYNPSRINVGSLAFNNSLKTGAVSPMYVVFSIKENAYLSADYLFSLLKSEKINEFILQLAQGAVRQQLRFSDLKVIKIPLPPLEIQEQIVEELNGYAGIIAGAKQIAQNWKPKIDIDPEWEKVKIGDVAKVQGGYAFKSQEMTAKIGAQIIKIGNVKDQRFDYQNNPSFIDASLFSNYKDYQLSVGDILISMTGTAGKRDYGNVCMVDMEDKFLLNQRVGRVIPNSKVVNEYLFFALNQDETKDNFYLNTTGGVRQGNISNKQIESIEIPLPPLAIQK